MATDILGTTSEEGLGAKGKSRTPKKYVSSMKLNTGGRRQGLSAGLGMVSQSAAGTLSAPDLRSRNITPFIQDTPTAEGSIVSEDAFAQGMSTLGNAVESYVSHIEDIRAKEALITLNEDLSALYYGVGDDVEGFRSTEGFAAVDGYREYSSAVDKLVKSALEGLNPYARQKAVMEAFTKRDKFLNVATGHVVEQKNTLDLASRQREREDILRDVITDPRNALGQYSTNEDGEEVYTPSQAREQYYNTFKLGEEPQAKAGWSRLIKDAASRVYIDNRSQVDKHGNYVEGSGLTDAQVFRDTVGATELSKDELVNLDKQLFAWQVTESRMYVQDKNSREAADNKLAVKQKATTYHKMVASFYDESSPNKMSIAQASQLLAANKITGTQFSSYKSMVNSAAKSGADIKGDIAEYNIYNRQVADLLISNAVADESSSLSNEISLSPLLSGSQKKALLNTVSTNINKKRAANRSDAIKAIDVAISDTYDSASGDDITRALLKQTTPHKTDTADRLEYDAVSEYDLLIEEGKTHREAKDLVIKKYSDKGTKFAYLPFIQGYGKPASVEAYQEVKRQISSDLASGKISQDQRDSATVKLTEYFNYLKGLEKVQSSDTIMAGRRN